jgi:RNA polymerase sigma-54 factor
MSQSDVAGDTGLHHTTVGRCVGDLVAATPQGLVSLRDLFSVGIGMDTGDPISSRAVQEQIKQLIVIEKPDAPLSDAEICRKLNDHGVSVKRRTVSKYRETVGIPNRRGRLENERPSHA